MTLCTSLQYDNVQEHFTFNMTSTLTDVNVDEKLEENIDVLRRHSYIMFYIHMTRTLTKVDVLRRLRPKHILCLVTRPALSCHWALGLRGVVGPLRGDLTMKMCKLFSDWLDDCGCGVHWAQLPLAPFFLGS